MSSYGQPQQPYGTNYNPNEGGYQGGPTESPPAYGQQPGVYAQQQPGVYPQQQPGVYQQQQQPPIGYQQQYPYQQQPAGYQQPQPYYQQGPAVVVVAQPMQAGGQPAYPVTMPMPGPPGMAGAIPYGQPGHINRNGSFYDGLCDCFNSFSICMLSWCIPPYRFALTHSRAVLGDFNNLLMLYGIPWVLFIIFYILISVSPWFFLAAISCNFFIIALAMNYRLKLRTKYNIRGDQCEDCMVHSFCSCCGIAQEGRHVDLDHGFAI